MNMVSFSSSYGRCAMHICFKVKYCHKIFSIREVKNECSRLFKIISKKYKIIIDELGFDLDHVHMMICLHPDQKLSEVVKYLKGISAKFLLEKFPYLRKRYFWGGHLWNPAYYFDSVGHSTVERMKNYVKNQEDKWQKTLPEFS